MGQEVGKWIDKAMFTAEKSDAAKGPQVFLLSCWNDPLGQIAACAKMYLGEVVRDLADVTDDERRHYAEEMKKTKLKMPLEAVSLHFMIEGVTRGFTHQMVRQRTAAYAQESTRFAVKEDLETAVALPPSLAGTVSRQERVDEYVLKYECSESSAYVMSDGGASDLDRKRWAWDLAVSTVGDAYRNLVDSGMPAEDARGLMPTNITTRLNYITNLRGLLDHAGNRLCTQAQFEWRVVFAQIAKALRTYGETQKYRVNDEDFGGATMMRSSAWQFDLLASLLQPVCYQTGACQFKADFDRACSIRSRVDANADINRPSSEWATEHENKEALHQFIAVGVSPRGVVREGTEEERGRPVFIGAIHPSEWLMDPGAAR
jgi:flavin-dependent thymidylate synthase